MLEKNASIIYPGLDMALTCSIYIHAYNAGDK